MRLSLDHITVADTTPAQLARLASATGCAGICAFLHSMPVLPAMPDYDLVADAAARRETRAVLAGEGVAVDLVYPFTLAGRTLIADFRPALEAAAELGAPLANLLCYDRDPQRRIEKIAELAQLAAGFGIGLAIEFYPPSQVRSLAEALAAIAAVGRDDVGVTLDLLHLVRSGEMPGALPLLADSPVRIAQLCDGPATIAPELIEWEAGIQRLLPGEGAFDCAAFLAALAPGTPVSVEVPQQGALVAGTSALSRASAATDAARRMLRD